MNIWKTPGLSLQLIQGICKKHGISSRCNLITDRSQLVFASEDQLVIKVFSPEEPDFCQNERIFLKQLHQQLPIPTPYLHASGSQEGYGYIIMEQLQGIPLEQAWDTFTATDRRRIVAQLGRAVRALHALPVESFAAAPFKWRPLMEKQIKDLSANHRKFGLDEKWITLLEEYISPIPGDFCSPSALVPVHTELMGEHVFVKQVGNHWDISGLIDFEPSMTAIPEYDFCAVGVFITRGDGELLRLFLSSYGYEDSQLTAELSRRLMKLLLLHRYCYLEWFISFLPEPERFTRIKQLEQCWFGGLIGKN